jgi:hypothetical protein
MTPFDEEILPKELQMQKALLPFLPANLQKTMAIFIKWTELDYTIRYFRQHIPTQQPQNPGNLMNAIKPFLPQEEQTQMEQFADIFENMDMYRDMFEGFSSAFTPESGQEEPT